MLWYSLEAPHRGASNEYPQHMFSLRSKKDISIFLMKKSALSCWTWIYPAFANSGDQDQLLLEKPTDLDLQFAMKHVNL